MLDNVKKYLLGRLDSLTAWVGILGIPAELILHRDPSTLILAAFVALIALPQDRFSEIFAGWTKRLREYDKK